MKRKAIHYYGIFFSLIGLVLSIYAIILEKLKFADHNFEASCDISETISCSNVMLSRYSRIFSMIGLIPENSILDISNAHYGVLFYCFYFLILCMDYFSIINLRDILLFMSTLSMILSLYLCYILYFIMNNICLICYSTYICNISLFIVASRLSLDLNEIQRDSSKKK